MVHINSVNLNATMLQFAERTMYLPNKPMMSNFVKWPLAADKIGKSWSNSGNSLHYYEISQQNTLSFIRHCNLKKREKLIKDLRNIMKERQYQNWCKLSSKSKYVEILLTYANEWLKIK